MLIKTTPITRKMDSTFTLKKFMTQKVCPENSCSSNPESLVDQTEAERGPVRFCFLPYYARKGTYLDLQVI